MTQIRTAQTQDWGFGVRQVGDRELTTGLGCPAPPNEEVAGSEDRGKAPRRRQGLLVPPQESELGLARRNLRLGRWGDGPVAGSPPPPSRRHTPQLPGPGLRREKGKLDAGHGTDSEWPFVVGDLEARGGSGPRRR